MLALIIILAVLLLLETIFIVTWCRKSIGVLRVDRSDPTEQPYLFLELSTDVNDILSKKYVMLRVNPNSYISSK